jgi:hypothetical protein
VKGSGVFRHKMAQENGASPRTPAPVARAAGVARRYRDGTQRLWNTQGAPAVQIARRALEIYVRSPWLAIDVLLLLAVFAFSFRSPFDASYFFTTAFFLLGVLSVVGGAGLIYGAMLPEAYLPLAREHGVRQCLTGLILAIACIRAVACLSLLVLALLFQRFTAVAWGDLIGGMLGLLLSCVLLGILPVVFSLPPASPELRIGALIVLVLSLASFNVTGSLLAVLFIARLPLLPFIACYALCQGNASVWAWLGAPLLTLGALTGLAWLATSRLAPPPASPAPPRRDDPN